MSLDKEPTVARPAEQRNLGATAIAAKSPGEKCRAPEGTGADKVRIEGGDQVLAGVGSGTRLLSDTGEGSIQNALRQVHPLGAELLQQRARRCDLAAAFRQEDEA